MLIEILEDRMGNIIAEPVSDRWWNKFSKHMQEMTGNRDARVFLQQGMGAEEFLQDIPARARREVEQGFTAVIRIDPWEYGNMLGWDAHTVAEQ